MIIPPHRDRKIRSAPREKLENNLPVRSLGLLAIVLWLAFLPCARGAAETNRPAAVPSAASKPATGEVAQAASLETSATNASETTILKPKELSPEGLFNSNLVLNAAAPTPAEVLKQSVVMLELARDERRDRSFDVARSTLQSLLYTNAPPEVQRMALLEMALLAQDQNQLLQADAVYEQYLQKFPRDPSIPEIYLKQGVLLRRMGFHRKAIAKFYAVMTGSLSVDLKQLDYYQKLTLQAQTEIADTYYSQGEHDKAAEKFSLLLREDSRYLNKEQIQYKLVRSLSSLAHPIETVAQSQSFLDRYGGSAEEPEVRFLLASALKQLGRNPESMRQVLLLLQSQQGKARTNPELWVYWQRKAGNQIANEFYTEGDYANSLEIYLSLLEIDKTMSWQISMLYQLGLVFEKLQQPEKASQTYTKIMDLDKTLPADERTMSLQTMLDMAKWRKTYVAWLQSANSNTEILDKMPSTNATPAAPAR